MENLFNSSECLKKNNINGEVRDSKIIAMIGGTPYIAKVIWLDNGILCQAMFGVRDYKMLGGVSNA